MDITASFGCSPLDTSPASALNDLITAADSALYRAKRAGRNRVASSSAGEMDG